MTNGELPSPVHILLAYAADGWAARNGQFSPSGNPRHPTAAQWQSIAHRLLAEPDGLDTLRGLAEAGMAAWGVHATIMNCVAPAFAASDFGARLAQQLAIAEPPKPPHAPVTKEKPPRFAMRKQPGGSYGISATRRLRPKP